MYNQDHIKRLFQQYLNEEISKDEIKELISYLQDQRHEQLFSDLIQRGLDDQQLISTKKLTVAQEENINNVRQVLEELVAQDEELIKIPQTSFFRSFMRYVAIFVLFAIGAFAGWHYFGSELISDTIEEIIVRTEVGEKKRIMLSDGTEVHLNHLSSIRYPQKFATKNREVIISGEVSFNVHKDPTKPFVVKSLDIETKVLGTNFIVKAYDDDPYIWVSVLEGKVSVHDGQDTNLPLILSENQQVIYDKHMKTMGGILQIKQSDIGTWEQGVIRLRDMSFEEAIKVLERTYDIKINFTNNLNDCPIYADINEQDSIGKVLSLLALSINGKYKNMGNKMWEVSGKGCTP